MQQLVKKPNPTWCWQPKSPFVAFGGPVFNLCIFPLIQGMMRFGLVFYCFASLIVLSMLQTKFLWRENLIIWYHC